MCGNEVERALEGNHLCIVRSVTVSDRTATKKQRSGRQHHCQTLTNGQAMSDLLTYSVFKSNVESDDGFHDR